MPGPPFQVVILAGGDSKRLYPLTSGLAKVLLPVGNKPLLHYPLNTLADAHVKHALLVAVGDQATAAISSYLARDNAALGVDVELVALPDGTGTADALRSISSRLTADTLVVMSGDMLCDVPLQAVVTTHSINNAIATVLLGHTKSIAVGANKARATTQGGNEAVGVDYIGLDASQQRLLVHASSPEQLRDLTIPLSVLRRYGMTNITTTLVDAHLYVFSRSILAVLANKPELSSLKFDVISHLTKLQQLQQPHRTPSLDAADEAGNHTDDGDGSGAPATALPGSSYMELSHADVGPARAPGGVGVYLAPADKYCARVNSIQAFGEVNRDVASSEIALHLTGHQPTRYDNIVAESSKLGAKSTVGNACIVGEHCVIGDKCSIKRSVLGNGCKLANNVKIINSVLMDNVTVGEGCHIQNSILCTGAQVQDRNDIKDCQVGPGFVVSQQGEHKDEILAKT